MPRVNGPVIVPAAKNALQDGSTIAQGLLTQNFERGTAQNTALMTGGTAYAVLVPVRAGMVVGNGYVHLTSAGSSTTLFKLGIYSLDGATQYAVTADKSSLMGTAGTKTLPLSAAWTVPAITAAIVVVVSTASVTLPTLLRGHQSSGETQIGSSSRPYATVGTSLSDLPAVTLTFSATNGTAFWAGLGI